MTREEFEAEAEDIKRMCLNYYKVRDRAQKLRLRREILIMVQTLLKY